MRWDRSSSVQADRKKRKSAFTDFVVKPFECVADCNMSIELQTCQCLANILDTGAVFIEFIRQQFESDSMPDTDRYSQCIVEKVRA